MRVKFWQSTSLHIPVLEFIEDQPDEAAQRIMKTIDHLTEKGLDLLASPNKMKQLKGYKGLFELRIDFKGVYYRIIFCVINGIAWLLSAFKKKDNRTKNSYIDVALGRQRQLSLANS